MTRRSSNYPPELRERAVRMVAEVRPDYPSDWPAIVAVAAKLGIGTAETLRKWVRQAEVNAGQRPGVTSEESAEIRRLKRPSARARRDELLKPAITRVHADNYGVYGARKVWLALNREGTQVARCTVARLMRELGLRGARRGKKVRTTVADPAAARPADLVRRQFSPAAPDRLWVADYTYVPTWAGMVYVAFVIDAYSRRILGWRAATSMKTGLVLDALEQALWTRRRDGASDLAGLVHHTDAGSQYTSIAFTERLAAAGVSPSVGTVGDAYDNALAESVIGLFKTELIKPRRPWHTAEQVEIATLEYVDWFNHRRLYEACGDIPPAELETAYYSQNTALAEAGHSAN